MGAAQRRYEQEEQRAPLRLIPGGKAKSGRVQKTAVARSARDARHQAARPFRRIYATAVAVCVLLVALGSGPVFLAAQATRSSQQALRIQESLDAANARSEQLEMQRSVLTSSLRVNTIAQAELGMVPATDGHMIVELSSTSPRPVTAKASTAARAGSQVELPDLARLTAGQSSALMVGDVGLAATR